MRFTSTLVLSTLCWSFQSASASTAHVYTYDPPSRPRPNVQSRSLSPVEARLVIAQRAGVEDYHRSNLMSDGVITAVNDFGARTPLFADEKDEVKKAFILLQGDSSSKVPSLQPFPSFELSPAPDAASSRDLFIDLARQSDPSSFLKLSDADLSALLQDRRTESSNGDLFYIASSASDADALITRLAATRQWSLTALVLPNSPSESNTFTWGTYTMPGAHSLPHHKRQQSSEAPLAFPAVQSSSGSSSFSAPVNAVQDDDNTSPSPSPFAGIKPACYTSQAACEKETRNCTGHGSCALKYHDPDVKVSCFACECKPSHSDDRLRTTYWGGPACQKKDISVEFWLISLFTVGLVGLIGFAVGAVWEMGSEPLPSVIGAGVSGAGARK